MSEAVLKLSSPLASYSRAARALLALCYETFKPLMLEPALAIEVVLPPKGVDEMGWAALLPSEVIDVVLPLGVACRGW